MSSKTIIVIERDADLADTLADILHLEGYRCIVMNSVTDLDELEASANLLLCDIRISNRINGMEVLTHIRNHPNTRRTPFVMMSGVTEVEAIRQAMRLGANYYLAKPFRIEHLLRVVDGLTSTPTAVH